MNVEEMKKKKTELGFSCEQISDRSGVPLGTVQKIFSGITKRPRYDTICQLEKAFPIEHIIFIGVVRNGCAELPEIFVDVRVHIAVHKIADGGSVTEFVARTAVARHEMLFHRIARNRIGKIFECGVDIFASVL